MICSKISMSKFTLRAASLAVALIHAGCSSSSPGSGGTGNGVASSGSGSHGPAASSGSAGSSRGSSGVASSSGNTNGGGTGATSGASTSTSTGSPSAASGSTGSSTSGGDAGGPDGGGDAAAVGGNCQTGDSKPCGSFTTAGGMTIQLGPYGAQMDVNVGKGFTNAVQSGDMPANAATCSAFVNSFGEDPKLGAQLLQTTANGVSLDFSLYTVYRPASWPEGPIPVITWGNGTCAQPEGYGALLRYVASYGYFVVAANSRWVGAGTPAPMLHALDYAAAANMDSTSPYYQKLDMTKVGAMGHSQGGSATATAASDSRVKDVIIFNAVDSGVAKPYLSASADMDITGFTAASMATAIDAAAQPAAYLYWHNPVGMGSLRGHLVIMLSPERATAPTVAWWQMMFRNDSASHDMLVGANCGFCNHSSDYNYGANTLLK
jgi:hypothetical protein